MSGKRSERYVCTKEAPWTEDKGMAVHPDAIGEGETWDSLADRYYCPNCGLHFNVEVGQ